MEMPSPTLSVVLAVGIIAALAAVILFVTQGYLRGQSTSVSLLER